MEPEPNFLGGIKHQWPYPSWEDIGLLTSTFFWVFVALLFAGLLFVPRPTLRILIPFVPIAGFLWGFFSGGLIVIYSVLIALLAALSLLRHSRYLMWAALITTLAGDALLALSYVLDLLDYHQIVRPQMASGPGPYKIPGELWEGMQNEQAFLIFYSIFAVLWGIYLYRNKPRRDILPS
jgi:hypothetical protein